MITGHSLRRLCIVFRHSLQQHQSSVQKVLPLQDGSESDDENSDDDNVRTVPFPMSDLSIAMESSSIHMEIKDTVGAYYYPIWWSRIRFLCVFFFRFFLTSPLLIRSFGLVCFACICHYIVFPSKKKVNKMNMLQKVCSRISYYMTKKSVYREGMDYHVHIKCERKF